MAKSIALLSYEFLFDPSEVWSHLSEFEEDFGRFLKEHNLEAEVLNSVNPRDGRRILFIKANKKVGVMGMSNADTTKQLNTNRTLTERLKNG